MIASLPEFYLDTLLPKKKKKTLGIGANLIAEVKIFICPWAPG